MAAKIAIYVSEEAKQNLGENIFSKTSALFKYAYEKYMNGEIEFEKVVGTKKKLRVKEVNKND